jgi:hypothetical protein
MREVLSKVARWAALLSVLVASGCAATLRRRDPAAGNCWGDAIRTVSQGALWILGESPNIFCGLEVTSSRPVGKIAAVAVTGRFLSATPATPKAFSATVCFRTVTTGAEICGSTTSVSVTVDTPVTITAPPPEGKFDDSYYAYVRAMLGLDPRYQQLLAYAVYDRP